MARRPAPRSRAQPRPRRGGYSPHRDVTWTKKWFQIGTIAAVVGLVLGLFLYFGREDSNRLNARAEAAAASADWATALRLWRKINASSKASGSTHMGEAKACLGLGRAAQAERALRSAVAATPEESEAWLLLLEILRVEERPLEALRLGRQALDRLPPEARPQVLRELTLATLTDLPDDVIRRTLRRWIEADPEDIDAQVALLQRIAAEPRADDPDRPSRLATLEALLASHADHPGVREALVAALGDAGEPERGREVLDGWPTASRDALYWRLRGRWELEHDHEAGQAIESFRTALESLPQDWRTHYRLARALQVLGRSHEARVEAEKVSRIRELLDPASLGPTLDSALAHMEDPAAIRTLADLTARAGLVELAVAWQAAAQALQSAAMHAPGGITIPVRAGDSTTTHANPSASPASASSR